MNDFISVLMPVYNDLKYLGQSISSILKQTHENFEFIILDDGSTENVEGLVKRYNDKRIRYYRNINNIGLTKSLNICLDLAEGDYIARHDSDDISRYDRFEWELKEFKDNRNVGLVSCWGRQVDTGGNTIPHIWFDTTIRIEESKIKKYIYTGNYIVGSGAIFTRKVFEKIGYYDEYFVTAQDYNYWLRILKYFDLKIAKRDLYYIHDNANSVRKKNKFKADWIIPECNRRANENTIIKNRDNFIWEKSFR
jgi:glycosyltransferase involved in cell wall biosynthesis